MVDPQLREQLQAACERGQEQLIDTQYLAAAATLAGAEKVAWDAQDFDTLGRLYMPLQEARRQIRLRCAEGAVAPVSGSEFADADAVLDRYPQGELLVTDPGLAASVRQRAADRGLYVEALIATAGPAGITLLPFAGPTPSPEGTSIQSGEWPPPTSRGTPATFAQVSAQWERLHAPFLAAADAEPDPVQRMTKYRRTIEVDYGCELAHQRLSATARELARQLARHAP